MRQVASFWSAIGPLFHFGLQCDKLLRFSLQCNKLLRFGLQCDKLLRFGGIEVGTTSHMFVKCVNVSCAKSFVCV